MADNFNENEQDELELERRRKAAAKRRRKAKKRRKKLIKRALIFAALVVLLIIVIVCLVKVTGKNKTVVESSSKSVSTEVSSESESSVESSAETSTDTNDTKTALLASAKERAQTYDYDAAISMLQGYSNQNDADIAAAISEYTSERDACVTVDVSTVPHIFFHSLINDSRGFIVSDQVTEGRVTANNAAMCTVDEFDHVLEYMYEAGYVMITLDDMVTENEDGTFTANTNIKLPADKKAFLMSEDDLSYYHAYGENGAQGYADKLVLDENGEVKAQYVDPDGNTLIGDYDMVPRLETFIKNHPDFVYHDARPTIALTGYNGIFGYVTNDYYANGGDYENLSNTQIQWLESHPDYDYDTDCAEAKKIADALKAQGWTFASHTYGHLDASSQSLEALQRDNERWKTCVGAFIGDTNKIIFAFGADIGSASNYTMDNEKYAYYKSEGFDIFCNCDGTLGWTQITSDYVRTGRFAIDGFTLYQAITPDGNSYSRCSSNYEALGVKDIASWFDKNRTTPIDSE